MCRCETTCHAENHFQQCGRGEFSANAVTICMTHRIQIHVDIKVTRDGVEVATKRTWFRTNFYPETFAFDLETNNFVRIVRMAATEQEFRQLQKNNPVMTATLPLEFRFEVAIKLGVSTVSDTYENIFAGKCFVPVLQYKDNFLI